MTQSSICNFLLILVILTSYTDSYRGWNNNGHGHGHNSNQWKQQHGHGHNSNNNNYRPNHHHQQKYTVGNYTPYNTHFNQYDNYQNSSPQYNTTTFYQPYNNYNYKQGWNTGEPAYVPQSQQQQQPSDQKRGGGSGIQFTQNASTSECPIPIMGDQSKFELKCILPDQDEDKDCRELGSMLASGTTVMLTCRPPYVNENGEIRIWVCESGSWKGEFKSIVCIESGYTFNFKNQSKPKNPAVNKPIFQQQQKKNESTAPTTFGGNQWLQPATKPVPNSGYSSNSKPYKDTNKIINNLFPNLLVDEVAPESSLPSSFGAWREPQSQPPPVSKPFHNSWFDKWNQNHYQTYTTQPPTTTPTTTTTVPTTTTTTTTTPRPYVDYGWTIPTTTPAPPVDYQEWINQWMNQGWVPPPPPPTLPISTSTTTTTTTEATTTPRPVEYGWGNQGGWVHQGWIPPPAAPLPPPTSTSTATTAVVSKVESPPEDFSEVSVHSSSTTVTKSTKCPSLRKRTGVKLECLSKIVVTQDEESAFLVSQSDCKMPQRVGTEATYTCMQYYESSAGLTLQYRKCKGDGTWTGGHNGFSCSLECGKSNPVGRMPLITNGEATYKAQWPWHAALYFRDPDVSTKFEYTCGATLINKRAVLTAAHCVTRFYSTKIKALKDFRIDLGRCERTVDDEFVQTFSAETIIPHPSYNPHSFDSDIALIILNGEVDVGFHVRPICYPQSQNSAFEELHLSDGSLGTVVGFGKNEKNELNDILHMARLKVISQRECAESFTDTNYGTTLTKSTTFCAGLKNGTNVCSGDSGGGIYFPLNTGGESRWYLQGLVSVGIGTNDNRCDPTRYSVFTRVSSYADWIVRVLSESEAL